MVEILLGTASEFLVPSSRKNSNVFSAAVRSSRRPHGFGNTT